jgi:gliding motility-associated-like protein
VVTVTPISIPTISAGPDQTIVQGTTTFLEASGGVNYAWTPITNLSDQNSANPIADPGTSTTYCVAGEDANGCVNFACTQIEVTPSDTVIIYNAFSPNGDGVNDVLYIGNLQKFPDNKVEVFNRNGKLVFQESPYKNDWNGKIDGAEIPAATYYVVFIKGEGKGKVGGAVTIIR